MDYSQADAILFANSTTYIQYPFVPANACIRGSKVIMNFVHMNRIHVPSQIILDRSVKTIIVPQNNIYQLEQSHDDYERIIQRIHDAVEVLGNDVRVILPLTLANTCHI